MDPDNLRIDLDCGFLVAKGEIEERWVPIHPRLRVLLTQAEHQPNSSLGQEAGVPYPVILYWLGISTNQAVHPSDSESLRLMSTVYFG